MIQQKGRQEIFNEKHIFSYGYIALSGLGKNPLFASLGWFHNLWVWNSFLKTIAGPRFLYIYNNAVYMLITVISVSNVWLHREKPQWLVDGNQS